MNRTVYKIQFAKRLPVGMVDYHLMTAALAAESLYGRNAVRLDAVARLNSKNRTVIIDAETQVGVDLAKMFMGFMTNEYGEKSFAVTKAEEFMRFDDQELLARVIL
ncbi:MAG: hypothetical protein ABFD83_14335 [Armatimonadota bacterium]